MEYEVCIDCRKAWERLPAGEVFTRDGEMMAFDKPCDNCAFRGGSPERSDPERWQALQESITYAGGVFFCHKGVPFELDPEGGDKDFEYPTVETKPVVVMGQELPASVKHEVDKMRICRGYLNAHVVPEMKRHAR